MARVSSAGWERRGGRAFNPDQRDDPGRVFRLGDKLPGARDAGQAVAAPGRFVIAAQLFQRGLDRVLLCFLEWLGFVAVLGGGGQQIAQFLGRERFLGGK